MNESYNTHPFKPRSLLPFIFTGALIAPFFVILFSAMHANQSMRVIPALAFVFLAGAAGGFAVKAITQSGMPEKSRRAVRWTLGILAYLLMVFIGFIIARLGPFNVPHGLGN